MNKGFDMLKAVLAAIEAAAGPITVRALSVELGIELSALQGMIAYWVQKGKLQTDSNGPAISPTCTVSSCSASCSGTESCHFVAKMPRTYTIPLQSEPEFDAQRLKQD